MAARKLSGETKKDARLVATGTIHVMLTMDMQRWIRKDSVNKFLGLRDRDEYAGFLWDLPKHIDRSKFVEDTEAPRLEALGHDLGVFRGYVYENLFMPTFNLCDRTRPSPILLEPSPEKNDAFLERWNEWPIKRIRLSRGGTITVKLERKIEEDTDLVEIAAMVLGLEMFEPQMSEVKAALEDEESMRQFIEHFTPARRKPWGVQWVIADEVVRQFLLAIPGDAAKIDKAKGEAVRRHPFLKKITVGEHALVWNDPNSPEHGFFLNVNTSDSVAGDTQSLRDRYVVFALSKLADSRKRSDSLVPEKLKASPSYCRCISSLLEGVAIGGRRTGTVFAAYKNRQAKELVEKDLATWQNELCLLTLDNALAYYTDHTEIYFPSRNVEHGEYWGSIIRGIEHLMEVRVQAQMMASETAEKLVQAAEFTRIVSGPMSLAPSSREPHLLEDRIRRFHLDVTYLARMAGHLRNWSSPVSIAKADFAATKFGHWLKISEVDRLLNSVDTNLRDINAILSHYDDTQIQLDAQSTNDLTLLMTVLFSGVMVVLSLLSLPSFVADLGRSEIPRIFAGYDNTAAQFFSRIGILIVLGSFIVVGIVTLFSTIRIQQGQRRRGRSWLRLRRAGTQVKK